ncbi:MAG: hypothetical protein ACRYE7_00130 [Janthinobacterium lividum]
MTDAITNDNCDGATQCRNLQNYSAAMEDVVVCWKSNTLEVGEPSEIINIKDFCVLKVKHGYIYYNFI